VVRRGKVRRAKLYYLRDRVGQKATRIKEKRDAVPTTTPVAESMDDDGEG
ncbi:MAG: 50S ribosomal protein L19, partial [Saprospiraceae bacterium]|nr:50S ribosomal protein L19 [Saprospiraceae bacterium]